MNRLARSVWPSPSSGGTWRRLVRRTGVAEAARNGLRSAGYGTTRHLDVRSLRRRRTTIRPAKSGPPSVAHCEAGTKYSELGDSSVFFEHSSYPEKNTTERRLRGTKPARNTGGEFITAGSGDCTTTRKRWINAPSGRVARRGPDTVPDSESPRADPGRARAGPHRLPATVQRQATFKPGRRLGAAALKTPDAISHRHQ